MGSAWSHVNEWTGSCQVFANNVKHVDVPRAGMAPTGVSGAGRPPADVLGAEGSEGGSCAGALLEGALQRLRDAGIEHPRRNAEWLLCEVLSKNRAGLYANLRSRVGLGDSIRFEEMLRRRLKHEPLQYILGYAEFRGLRLEVTPDVLIPRCETEELVEVVLACVEGVPTPVVFDAGTGSGCIALAVKAARPDAVVTACDLSMAALGIAHRNATAHGLSVSWIRANLLEARPPGIVPRPLDVLVSNPPYVPEEEAATIPEEVRAYEPRVALFVSGDPLVFYHRLSKHGRALIGAGGWIVLEAHADYAEGVGRILEGDGYGNVQVRQDLAGRDRLVLGRR